MIGISSGFTDFDALGETDKEAPAAERIDSDKETPPTDTQPTAMSVQGPAASDASATSNSSPDADTSGSADVDIRGHLWTESSKRVKANEGREALGRTRHESNLRWNTRGNGGTRERVGEHGRREEKMVQGRGEKSRINHFNVSRRGPVEPRQITVFSSHTFFRVIYTQSAGQILSQRLVSHSSCVLDLGVVLLVVLVVVVLLHVRGPQGQVIPQQLHDQS